MEIKIPDGEVFYGGRISRGTVMPYKEGFTEDLSDSGGNQVNYLLLSNMGRYIYSSAPFCFTVNKNSILIENNGGEILTGIEGNSLKSAYLYAMKTFYPSEVKTLEEDLFRAPQFNTWIELIYDQNQKDIIKYAQDIITNGFTPGVLMIDDNWQEDYGVWKFNRERFPDPHKMTELLHKMGFKIMLWLCPFVSPDCSVFRELYKKGFLINNPDGTPYITEWWNGWSAVLDLSNPGTVNFYKSQLDFLQSEYGIDGFKFDAGAPSYYKKDKIYYEKECSGFKQSQKFTDFACNYPLSELRETCNRPEGKAAQRLRDKNHSWTDNGVNALIPDSLAQSLMGYQFICPDMIGGGEYGSFTENSDKLDEELIVRNAQASALLPMMQFSAAPWRILSKENLQFVKQAAELHEKFADYIINSVKASLETGECVIKSLEYAYPHKGYENINDEFIAGDKILAAPVINKGDRTRKVILPEGRWTADDGQVYEGNSVITVDAPLSRLPYFTLG